jgi:hypothetical protein
MELNITLAGANFRPADAKDFIKTMLNRDTKVLLQRDPTNAYDSNALKIVCLDDMDDEVFIGFVPKTDNAVLAMALDADGEYSIQHTGFIGTIQPTFRIEFTPPSIEERNAALDGVEDTDDYENGGTPSDDEISF